ncbi:MAG: DUF2846 domain-containing protein [Acidiferrobacterales bacterium]
MNNRLIVSWAAMLFLLTSGYVYPALAAEVPQAKPDKGLVVFYRLDKLAGSAIRFNLNHTSGPMGQLLRGTMIHKYFEPGEHQFWSQVISKDSITLKVEAGQIYFIRGETKMGVFAGRPQFTRVPESQAKADLANLK